MSKYNFQIEAATRMSGQWVYRIIETNSGKMGTWTDYKGIATILLDGKFFCAVTNYHSGIMPHEQVCEMVPQPTELLPETERVISNGEL